MAKIASRTPLRPGVAAGKRGRAISKLAGKKKTSLPRLAKVAAIFERAEESGLRREKDGRITGRVSAVLIEKAKARTGLTSDTELVEFALANVALEDNFAETFRKTQGTVDPDLKLGY
ncbi:MULTISPECIES: hypothetical protein [unclassified Mesorhizobium]|uniref:hypothetical protein n=1 Tax=unclassified Mesorhizobium TaxID=325217 RepID=UPI001FE1EA05|nr:MULTISPECIES: hypothetical protein [unclassified Mesorhizobium]